MVEIITRGRKPGEARYEATCRECRTVFRFARSEARYVSDQRDGDAVAINCPVCSQQVWINASLTI